MPRPDGLVDIALSGRQTYIFLRRPITREDWECPLFYVRRVKSFSMRDTIKPAHFIGTLGRSLPVEEHFPLISKGSTGMATLHTPQHLCWFLTTRIRHIFLGSIDTIQGLSILLNLSAKCTDLTSVTIFTPALGHPSIPTISAFLRGLMHVQVLAVHGLDQLAIAHLAQLPRLKVLMLRGSFESYAPPDEPSGDASLVPGAFSALEKLTFMRATLDCVTGFLAQTSNCPLVKFEIAAVSPEPTEPTSRAFYTALARHCTQASLRDIRIIRAHAVVADTIQPLLSFNSLVSVHLAHPVGFDLDDSAILAMARAWPQLQFLSLIVRPARHMGCRVTLQGVSAFAAHCPILHTLELMFNATVVPEIHDISPRAAQESLSFIDVALSPIGAPHRVAEFLGGIFLD
ncbi:hypothetical protein FB451DRAFT_1478653 [Mycena latifolia]|nr:hypothetical protein FB451DRAFT_1478653 [Mycena latifolia]